MRTGLAYTCARILLLVVALWLLYLVGVRGLALYALALLISSLASYVLLSKQRDIMSAGLSRRFAGFGRRAAEFRARIEDGAAAEDGPGGDTTAAADDTSGQDAAGQDADTSGQDAAGTTPASRRG